ncbi:MAG: hypothetical protein Q6J68_02770 [Thermostichales cyanobacterium SZTDM-1c_bins_54]
MMPWQQWDEDQRWEMLSAYLDGELSPQEHLVVTAWLDRDPQARRMLRDLQVLQRAWQHLPYPAQSTDAVVEGVMRRLQPRRRWAGTLAAGLGLLAVGGALAWRYANPQPLVSLEAPPVQIARRPSATRVAETYLLTPPRTQDPFVILFQDEPVIQ